MNSILMILMRGFPLGRIAGIPVSIHWTWIPIALYMTGEISGSLHAGAFGLLLGIIGTLLFFGSILLHELGHALAARTVGLGTDGITLHLLGGVARLRGEPRQPRDEMVIAAAGPVVSLALAGLFFGGSFLLRAATIRPATVDFVEWLAFANLCLAIFNLLPGLPLDGGRILRAWYWRKNGRRAEATQRVATIGEKIGIALLVVSIAEMIFPFGGPFGPMSALAAWFMIAAAREERARVSAPSSAAEAFFRTVFGGAARGASIFEALRRNAPRRSAPPPPAKTKDEVIDVDYVVHRDRRP